ncbi:MAG: hypothetical protein BRC29_03425 [Nanohaloarchaea archaeon SW_7_43_1]|nr:MAG: hypothetical protein BRC29_03425 [Nanohaloarchaea archaeon SW_7_43_1]
MKFSPNVRGSVRDIPFVLVLVFTIAMSSVVVYGGVSEAHDSFQSLNESNDSDISGIGKATGFMGSVLGVFTLIDAGAIILIGVFFLGAIYSALQVDASKIFAIPSFLFLLASLYLAGLLGDTYFLVAEQSALVSWFNQFPLTARVFSNFGVITGSLGAVLFIATYIKTRTVQEVGI